MNSPDALLDFHERTHLCLATLLDQCRDLTTEELHRELPGFGYGSVQLQIHHLLGGERYWIGVLQGRIDVDEDAPAYPSIDALESFRAQTSAATAAYLRGTTAADLNLVRTCVTWGNRERVLVPAYVVTRVLTHVFHHVGQVTAMCRLLGKPREGLDYPLA
jgi:uncharacterized damage-inducible protein DinB